MSMKLRKQTEEEKLIELFKQRTEDQRKSWKRTPEKAAKHLEVWQAKPRDPEDKWATRPEDIVLQPRVTREPYPELTGLLESLKPGVLLYVELRSGEVGCLSLVPGFMGLATLVRHEDPPVENRFIHPLTGKDVGSAEELPTDVVDWAAELED